MQKRAIEVAPIKRVIEKKPPKPPFDPFEHRRRSGEIAFIPGTNYLFEGRVVQLKVVEDDQCTVWDAAEGREVQCRLGELNLPKAQPQPWGRRPKNMTKTRGNMAMRIRSTMQLYLSLPKKERTSERLEELAVAFGMSGRNLRRRFAGWNGRLDSLLPATTGPARGSKRLCEAREQIIALAIDARKKIGEEWTVIDLVDDVLTACAAVKPPLDPPCKRTIEDRLRRTNYDPENHRKHGHKKAGEREEGRIGTYDPGLPLAQIEIDHTRVDLMVWDSVERVGLKRPWLTLVIDCASRVVLGFHLSFDAPNSDSVSSALLMALMPKHQLLKDHGLSGLKWDVWGKPKSVQTDWASEFRSKDFQIVCMNAGIKAKLRAFAQKHWGGRIERLIGTFMGKVHMLPGTTFSNPKARDGYDSEHRAIMDMGDMRMWLINQIVEYNNTPHGGRGLQRRTPYQMWKHLLTTSDGDYLPPPFVDPEFFKHFEYDLLPVEKNKQVHGRHIVWNNRPYENGIFSFFKVGSYVDIRYRPDRLRTILFRDTHGIIHEVATTQPPKRNVSLSEEKAIARAVGTNSAADSAAQQQRRSTKDNKRRVLAEAAEKTKAANSASETKRVPVIADDSLDEAEGSFVIPEHMIWN